ncbi:MAG: nitroreductase family protein [Deltaproteobacteria bacterium]|nr:nitroreductase family protein [Deltaproteobacteria bacterium]
MSTPSSIPYTPFDPDASPEEASKKFYETIRRRRSIRDFSDAPVSRETIENIVRAAGTAPSGAHKQPWRFVCVCDPDLKREIRVAAEKEERLFYGGRASDRWIKDIEPFGTDENKPFLEVAPWLIVVFLLTKGDAGDAVYYAQESVGIATGFLLAAIHHAGLSALTHTPAPLKFLSPILRRPQNERPFLLIPVGYPAPTCRVPDIARKDLSEIMIVNRE